MPLIVGTALLPALLFLFLPGPSRLGERFAYHVEDQFLAGTQIPGMALVWGLLVLVWYPQAKAAPYFDDRHPQRLGDLFGALVVDGVDAAFVVRHLRRVDAECVGERLDGLEAAALACRAEPCARVGEPVSAIPVACHALSVARHAHHSKAYQNRA